MLSQEGQYSNHMDDFFNQLTVPDNSGGPEPFHPDTKVVRQEASSCSGRGGSEDKKQPPAPPEEGWYSSIDIQQAPGWNELDGLISSNACGPAAMEVVTWYGTAPACAVPLAAGRPWLCNPHITAASSVDPSSFRGRADSLALLPGDCDALHVPPDRDRNKRERITIWNTTTQQKISGNASPMKCNLARYLRRNPHLEIYNGQDERLTDEQKIPQQRRFTVMHVGSGKCVRGAPRVACSRCSVPP